MALAFFVALLNHSSSRLQDLQENHESVLAATAPRFLDELALPVQFECMYGNLSMGIRYSLGIRFDGYRYNFLFIGGICIRI
jgi:hypothetical protein